MALLKEERKHTRRDLIVKGVPYFVIATTISLLTHQFVHSMAHKLATGGEGHIALLLPCDAVSSDSFAAIAGPLWTFGFAVFWFAVYMRLPRSLFAGAMAFVNATIRLPESITLFLQLLLHSRASLVTDEGSTLAIIGLQDPTLGILVLCFFSMMILFLSIIIVHDTKTVPWKWAVAGALFLALFPLQRFVISCIGPLLS